MLRIVLRTAPEILIVQLVQSIIYPLLNFVTSTWLLQYMINGFQNGIEFKTIASTILLVFGIYLIITLVFKIYYMFRSPIVSTKMEKQINQRLHKIAAEVELACYEDKAFYDNYVKASGDFVNRIYQVLGSLNGLIWQMVSLFTYSYLVISVDPFLFIFALIPVVISLIFGKKRNNIQHEYDMKRREEERQREYTRRTFYLCDYAKEMRLTNIHRVMMERFDCSVKNIISHIKHYGLRISAIDYLMNEAREVLASMGAMLYAIYCTLIKGTMLYGDCLVVINSIEQLVYILSNSVNSVMQFHGNSLYVDTIRQFIEYEPRLKEGELNAPLVGDLELKNVSFSYPGQNIEAIHNVNITVRAGEKIALVGHNGAGKSTLAKLMLRLYDPNSGEVRYGSRDVKGYKLSGNEGYRARFGVVFQDFRLFAMSVTDNVLLRRRKEGDVETVNQALEQSGISEKIATFEMGSEAVLTREFDSNGKVLSGGEAQKISIARTYAKECGIVLLDEPSAALDPVAEYQMYENMMQSCQSKSVIFISHRLSSAVLADRIYYLEDGKVLEEGTHEDLITRNGRYAELFRIQAKNYNLSEQEEHHG